MDEVWLLWRYRPMMDCGEWELYGIFLTELIAKRKADEQRKLAPGSAWPVRLHPIGVIGHIYVVNGNTMELIRKSMVSNE